MRHRKHTDWRYCKDIWGLGGPHFCQVTKHESTNNYHEQTLWRSLLKHSNLGKVMNEINYSTVRRRKSLELIKKHTVVFLVINMEPVKQAEREWGRQAGAGAGAHKAARCSSAVHMPGWWLIGKEWISSSHSSSCTGTTKMVQLLSPVIMIW